MDKQRRKGAGTIFQRKSDNRWVAQLTLDSEPGERRRKTVTVSPLDSRGRAKTEKQARAELEAKLLTLQRQKKEDGDIDTSGFTVERWMDYYYNNIAVKKVRPKTAAAYKSLITNHIIPIIGKVQLKDMKARHVRKVSDTIEGKRLSSATAAQAHRILAVALEYALREGKVAKNVARLTDAPRRKKPELVILTSAHGKAVLREIKGDRLASRIAAALLTGARQGELLGLELDRVGDDLDLSWQLQRIAWEHGCRDKECGNRLATDCPKRKITAPNDWEHRYLQGGLWLSRPKSNSGYRIIPLVDPLRSMIEVRIHESSSEPNPHGLLWTANTDKRRKVLDGAPIDPKYDLRYWYSALERASVPKARLHDARHTAASLLLDANVPEAVIVNLLGHSSYAQTRSYQNIDRRQRESAMMALSQLFESE